MNPASISLLLASVTVLATCENFCKSKPDSLYPNPLHCGKFYSCSHGNTNRFDCPRGLYFNPDILVCDWPTNVDCDPSTTPLQTTTTPPPTTTTPPPSTTITPPPPTTKTTQPQTTTTTPPTTTTTPSTKRDQNTQTTRPRTTQVTPAPVGASVPFCSSKADGMYPDPQNCHQFYHCVAGREYRKRCGQGLVFNPKGYCDWKRNVPCSATTTMSTTAASTSTTSVTTRPSTSPTTASVTASAAISSTTTTTPAPTSPTMSTSTTLTTAASATTTTSTKPITTTTSTSTTTTTTMTTTTTKATQEQPGCQRVVCYFPNWAHHRTAFGAKYEPRDIDPNLCTHIIYSFATLSGNSLIAFDNNDEPDTYDIGNFAKVTNLKVANPKVKVLLAVGGYNAGSDPFTQMVASSTNRAEFVRTTIQFLRSGNFDGIDLDWEYPAARGSPPSDKEAFAVLCEELRSAFEAEASTTGSERLLLTSAVSAGKYIIDRAYDVPRISAALDFINLMAYDLHGSWEEVTGHNSPLRARPEETGWHRYQNVEWAANYWVSLGAPKNKLVIGLPTYGRSFTLQSTTNTGVGAPLLYAGNPGPHTQEAGILAYYEVCLLKDGVHQSEYIVSQSVPYIVTANQWVGYDDPASFREKVKFIKNNEFGGAMVWDISLDDFEGVFCGQGKYPLLNAIGEECLSRSDEM